VEQRTASAVAATGTVTEPAAPGLAHPEAPGPSAPAEIAPAATTTPVPARSAVAERRTGAATAEPNLPVDESAAHASLRPSRPVQPAVPAEAAAEGPASSLQLMAISQRDGQPIAIINDHLVREGDSLDGIRVLHIREAEVEVEVHGRRRVLRF
jgi:hypothetical protein